MKSRGFSLLELVVVIALISILVAVALDRLLPYIDEAERVSVLRVEGQLRSTLVMEAAERIVRGQASTVTLLEGSNPFNFLAEPPKNYLGELLPGQQADAEARHWYFDAAERRLVYRRGEPFSLLTADRPRQDPAFTVRVAFADNDGNGSFDFGSDELYGVHFERIAGVSWLEGAERH